MLQATRLAAVLPSLGRCPTLGDEPLTEGELVLHTLARLVHRLGGGGLGLGFGFGLVAGLGFGFVVGLGVVVVGGSVGSAVVVVVVVVVVVEVVVSSSSSSSSPPLRLPRSTARLETTKSQSMALVVAQERSGFLLLDLVITDS